MATMDETLTIPVLQIHGDLDGYILVGTLRRCTRWAPHRQLYTIASGGHYVHQENPDEVNAEVARFART